MAEEKITLTLDPFAEKIETAASETNLTEKQKIEAIETLAEESLNEEERAQVDQFAKQIDITDATMVLQYGAGTQQKIADFSDNALQSVKNQELGDTGDMIAKLVGELKAFNGEIDKDSKGFLGLFKKTKYKIAALKAKYDKVEVNVNDIVTNLEGHQVTLMKDVAVLDQLYDKNLTYFKELSMYIIAGKKRLKEERETTLVELKKKADESALPEDAQKARDFSDMCDRFEKKIYDLELSRMVSIQMAPQIRLVQSNDTLMSEKIQSTVVNTIPLWKSQMIIALGLAHTDQALKAEKAVTDMTNELLKKNAEKLHQGTVNVAKENERGIIDIETLTHTNQELIATLDEVEQIRSEGRAKRIAAEAELARIETELKNKLLEIKSVK